MRDNTATVSIGLYPASEFEGKGYRVGHHEYVKWHVTLEEALNNAGEIIKRREQEAIPGGSLQCEPPKEEQ